MYEHHEKNLIIPKPDAIVSYGLMKGCSFILSQGINRLARKRNQITIFAILR
jgi:hypothetical protein